MPAILKSGTSIVSDSRRQLANFESLSPEMKRDTLDALEAQIADASEAELGRQSIAQLFKLACGASAFESYMDPRRDFDAMEFSYLDSSAFSRITNQMVYSRMVMGFNLEQYVFSKLIPERQAENLHGDKIPGMTMLGDDAEVIEEGGVYPRVGFGDEYIITEPTVKRGMILDITRETIFADRTRKVLENAATLGEKLGLNKEKRLCKVVIGATNNYNRNGTRVDTYQTATPWINDASNELLDYTDVENAIVMQGRILDPNTGETVSLSSSQVVVTRAKEITARRVLFAPSVDVLTDSLAVRTRDSNPINSMKLDLAVSQLMEAQMVKSVANGGLGLSQVNAAKYWFMGDFASAFSYEMVFPLTVTQAPFNSEAAFTRDIVASFKASERGNAQVLDPRRVIRSKN